MSAEFTPTRYKVAFGFLIFFVVASLGVNVVCGAIGAAVIWSIGNSGEAGTDVGADEGDASESDCDPYTGAMVLLVIGGLLVGGFIILGAVASLAFAGALTGLAIILHRSAVEPWIYTGACVFEAFCCGEILMIVGILLFVFVV